MITKDEMKKRLRFMLITWSISGTVALAYFLHGDFSMLDANSVTVMQFAVLALFIVHVFAMFAMTVLIYTDTIDRLRREIKDFEDNGK